jgi:hypothetical protein
MTCLLPLKTIVDQVEFLSMFPGENYGMVKKNRYIDLLDVA